MHPVEHFCPFPEGFFSTMSAESCLEPKPTSHCPRGMDFRPQVHSVHSVLGMPERDSLPNLGCTCVSLHPTCCAASFNCLPDCEILVFPQIGTAVCSPDKDHLLSRNSQKGMVGTTPNFGKTGISMAALTCVFTLTCPRMEI